MPPVVAAVISGVAAVAGATAAGVSTGVQIDAQQKQAAEQARVSRVNAMLAKAQSNDALTRGEYAAGDIRAAGRRASESARTQVAASGVSTVEGSLPNLFAVSEINASRDAQAVKDSAVRQAWGLEIEQKEHRARGQAAYQQGILGSIGTGVSGFSQAASSGIQAGVGAYGMRPYRGG